MPKSVFRIDPEAVNIRSSKIEESSRKLSLLKRQPKVSEGEKALRLPSGRRAE